MTPEQMEKINDFSEQNPVLGNELQYKLKVNTSILDIEVYVLQNLSFALGTGLVETIELFTD